MIVDVWTAIQNIWYVIEHLQEIIALIIVMMMVLAILSLMNISSD